MRDVIEALCAQRGWMLDDAWVTVPQPTGRSQRVRFGVHQTDDGTTFVRLMSLLGDASVLDERRMRAALRLNWTMPYGAVALASVDDEGEKVIMCATAFADAGGGKNLILAIEQLAAMADQYEQFVFGGDVY